MSSLPHRSPSRARSQAGLAVIGLALGAAGCPDGNVADAGGHHGDAGDGHDDADAGTNPGPDGGGDEGLTIYDIQDPSRPGHPREGRSVELDGVIVTGIDATTNERGFFVEEPAGGAYSGIFVYKPVPLDFDLTTLNLGDVVTVGGEYTEYNGLSEIHLMALETTGSAEVPAPVANPDLAADPEAYEGVLLELCGDCDVERLLAHDEVDTSCALLDDQLYDYALDTSMVFECIRGIWTYSFGDYKLLPRGPDDFVCAGGEACFPEPDAGAPTDAGAEASNDAGLDAGGADAGAGTMDAGMTDLDAGSADAGPSDAGSADAGLADGGQTDGGAADAGSTDAGSTDAGSTDAGSTDTGSADAGPTDAGGNV